MGDLSQGRQSLAPIWLSKMQIKRRCQMPEFFVPGGFLLSILAVVAGVVILIWPHIISYIIAIYLIIVGVLGIIAAVT